MRRGFGAVNWASEGGALSPDALAIALFDHSKSGDGPTVFLVVAALLLEIDPRCLFCLLSVFWPKILRGRQEWCRIHKKWRQQLGGPFLEVASASPSPLSSPSPP